MFALCLRKSSPQFLLISKSPTSILHKYVSYKNYGEIFKRRSSNFLRGYTNLNQRNIAIYSVLRQRAFDVNTNVTKDVILFKYENPKFFTTMNLFAICQLFFWGYLANFAYTCLKDAPISEQAGDVEWWRKINLGENKYRNTLTAICCIIGYGVLAVCWIYTLKSVRFLILRKGGKSVTIVTYGPFGKNRMMTVDLKHLSCQESRQNARVQLPIKVQNKWFYYILDMKGEFKNAQLFDYTAGLRRIWK